MNASKTESRSAEALSGLELAALQRRLGPEVDLGSATTIRDVAEAIGLPEIDVAAHLRRIRAETAFAEPIRARPPALPWIAGATLIVGLTVTGWRLYRNAPASLSHPGTFAPTPVTTITTHSDSTSPLTVYSQGGNGPEHPPSGFRVDVTERGIDQTGENMGQARALPYETVRDGLVRVATALTERTLPPGIEARDLPGTRYRGMDGEIFSSRPGFARVSMSGWAGSEVGWIAVPVTDADRANLRTMAEKLLADARKTQEEALAPVADPKAGLVSPPPAFSVRFAGRRLDIQRGPRVSFAPIPVPAVAARLEAAILNAAFRDRRPPVGPWTESASADAKIPQPDSSHVEIMSPDGVIVGEVPTVPGGEAATERAAHDLAGRAARDIDRVNRRALEKDGTPEP